MATPVVYIGDRPVSVGRPAYVIGEIGINHNGELSNALALIDHAAAAGCDAVKFQKRDPITCVPPDQRDVMRDTPWGRMSYLDYRYRIEFGENEYDEIDQHCKDRGIAWFASPWDVPSVEFLERYEPVCHKVASACITDLELLAALRATDRPVIISTGMSTMDEIRQAVEALDGVPLLIAHTTSTYPCPPAELNLRMIGRLAEEFDAPVGYSGHEVGLQTTVAAVVLGATFVERHITLDRAMWGSDQAASVEPGGLARLVRDIRTVEAAFGDGEKVVYESELPIRQKLRRVTSAPTDPTG